MSSDSFYSVFFLLDNRFFYLDAKNLKKTEHFLSDFLHLSTRSSVSSLPVPFYLVFYSLQFFSKNLFFILDFVHLSTRSSAFLLCFLFLTILCTQYFLSFYSIFFIFILDFVDLPTQSSAACFDDILYLSTRLSASWVTVSFTWMTKTSRKQSSFYSISFTFVLGLLPVIRLSPLPRRRLPLRKHRLWLCLCVGRRHPVGDILHLPAHPVGVGRSFLFFFLLGLLSFIRLFLRVFRRRLPLRKDRLWLRLCVGGRHPVGDIFPLPTRSSAF